MSFASNIVDFRCLANEQPKVVICQQVEEYVCQIKNADGDVESDQSPVMIKILQEKTED